MKPAVYEGSEAYIFISYAHKDSDRVFQIVNELAAQGYRIWYDEGIAPGSEWPENIAQHLNAAGMVMAFLSPNAVASPHCRREINFALSKRKPFLSVVLEKTEMPLGMEMQLSAQQSIPRYNYAAWDEFIDKILKCPAIEPCRDGAASEDQAAAEGEEALPTLEDLYPFQDFPADAYPEAKPEGQVSVDRLENSLFQAKFEGDAVAGSGGAAGGVFRFIATQTDGEAWHVKLEANYPTVAGRDYSVTYRFNSDVAGTVKFGDFQEFQIKQGENEVTGMFISLMFAGHHTSSGT